MTSCWVYKCHQDAFQKRTWYQLLRFLARTSVFTMLSLFHSKDMVWNSLGDRNPAPSYLSIHTLPHLPIRERPDGYHSIHLPYTPTCISSLHTVFESPKLCHIPGSTTLSSPNNVCQSICFQIDGHTCLHAYAPSPTPEKKTVIIFLCVVFKL